MKLLNKYINVFKLNPNYYALREILNITNDSKDIYEIIYFTYKEI